MVMPPVARSRMPAGERSAALLACANRLYLAQGYFPVPFEELARKANVSKALVYAYFKTQADLANAMLAAAMARFDRAAFEAACASEDAGAIIAKAAGLYFDIVEIHGPIVHLLLNDRYLDGKLDPELTDYIATCRRRTVRAMGHHPGLRPREAGAAIELFLAIVEDAGRAVYRGEMARDPARQLSHDLVLSGLAALGPGEAGLADLTL